MTKSRENVYYRFSRSFYSKTFVSRIHDLRMYLLVRACVDFGKMTELDWQPIMNLYSAVMRLVWIMIAKQLIELVQIMRSHQSWRSQMPSHLTWYWQLWRWSTRGIWYAGSLEFKIDGPPGFLEFGSTKPETWKTSLITKHSVKKSWSMPVSRYKGEKKFAYPDCPASTSFFTENLIKGGYHLQKDVIPSRET